MDSPAFLCNASRRAWKCVIAYLLASALVGKPAGRCGTYGDDLLGDRLHCVVTGLRFRHEGSLVHYIKGWMEHANLAVEGKYRCQP